MKNTSKTAKVIAKVTKAMANQACGAASLWGSYQPKEPKKPAK